MKKFALALMAVFALSTFAIAAENEGMNNEAGTTTENSVEHGKMEHTAGKTIKKNKKQKKHQKNEEQKMEENAGEHAGE